MENFRDGSQERRAWLPEKGVTKGYGVRPQCPSDSTPATADPEELDIFGDPQGEPGSAARTAWSALVGAWLPARAEEGSLAKTSGREFKRP